MSGTVEHFKGEDGQHYFRVKAANGETVSVSEGYTSFRDARRGHAALQRAMSTPEVPNEDPEVPDP